MHINRYSSLLLYPFPGGDVGARWVARYAEDERAYQIAYEKELEQKRKKSSARPADTVRSQGLSDIPGEVQSPPQRPRHTLNTDISGMVTNSIFALTTRMMSLNQSRRTLTVSFLLSYGGEIKLLHS